MWGELVPVEYEGLIICNKCSLQKHIYRTQKPSYKEPPKEVCFYTYKRINHFKYWHNFKKTTQIQMKY